MKKYGTFDILGPIMIGPSSSHTAGAARLGKVARDIVGADFKSVSFYLHGSFAETYRGHGTDKALVAGILGMEPQDENLRIAFEIAEKQGVEYEFIPTVIGEAEHPNTVKMVFHMNDGTDSVIMGCSIGGGNIIVNEINGFTVELTGEYCVVLIRQLDKKGILSKVTKVIADGEINIANMKLTRAHQLEAFLIVECDEYISEEIVNRLKKIEEVLSAQLINTSKAKRQHEQRNN
ncbi:MAG: L-serine ammonia-lyase, iron-sulfur-dependent subunit beta [Clostridium sp.]